jgi:hypothetical protein
VTEKEIILNGGVTPLDHDSVVVHCAASGLRYPPMVPLWQPGWIRLQTVRAGFPCFCGALAGYVEATRDDDRERNRLCPPNIFSDSPVSWVQMQLRGTLAARAYGAEPDITDWANLCALNPARRGVLEHAPAAIAEADARVAAINDSGLSRMAALVMESPSP